MVMRSKKDEGRRLDYSFLLPYRSGGFRVSEWR